VTAVVASVQSVDRTPLGMYAVVAVLFVVVLGMFCVLGVVSWGRFVGWLDGRETCRRERRGVRSVDPDACKRPVEERDGPTSRFASHRSAKSEALDRREQRATAGQVRHG